MAIKIIKQGKQTKFMKICPDCGCEFEYEQEDVGCWAGDLLEVRNAKPNGYENVTAEVQFQEIYR